MSRPKVTVVMRSKNSDLVIGQALAGLFSQDFTDFELLVVDSGSTDKTLEIVEQYPCRLIKIEAKAYYPGVVLNMAFAQAKADLIVFQNSDSVPLCQHTLGRLVAAFDDPEVDAALARQIPRPEAEPWVRRDYASSFPDAPRTPPWITLSLPLAAMRRSAWEAHNFYTDAWASEDTEWGHWAKAQGRKIKYVPRAITMHSHNYNLRQIYGRMFVEGEADAFIYRGRESFGTMAWRSFRSTAGDVIKYLKAGDLAGLPIVPIRRLIYNWAHYKGHCLGVKRLARGDSDASAGQAVVLDRYE